jgi:hypothetical protein
MHDVNTHADIDDFLMKSHTAFPAEPNVEDEAAWPGGMRKPQKFVGRLECFDPHAYGAHQRAEGESDCLVVRSINTVTK